MDLLTVVGYFASVFAIAHLYVGYRALSLPSRNTHKFRRSSPKESVIALLGDSHTHGHVGYSWVNQLRNSCQGSFVNAGVNGELAWNALQRLPSVLALKPQVIILLIGSNDVMGCFNAQDGQFYVQQHKLPQLPSEQFFQDNMRALLRQLEQSGVNCAVCTLPPLGEVRDSAINKDVDRFNSFIKKAAREIKIPVLDLNACIWQLIETDDAQKSSKNTVDYSPSRGIKIGRMYISVMKYYLLGYAWDDCGAAFGLRVGFFSINLCYIHQD